MNDIIYRLCDFINNNKNKDINYFIALTLLHDVKSIPTMNISVLAEKCYTSPAAITRFCKRIGYESFQQFKEYANKSVNEDSMSINNLDVTDPKRVAETFQSSFYKKIESWLHASKNMIDIEKVSHIIQLIHQSKKVSFFGTQ